MLPLWLGHEDLHRAYRSALVDARPLPAALPRCPRGSPVRLAGVIDLELLRKIEQPVGSVIVSRPAATFVRMTKGRG